MIGSRKSSDDSGSESEDRSSCCSDVEDGDNEETEQTPSNIEAGGQGPNTKSLCALYPGVEWTYDFESRMTKPSKANLYLLYHPALKNPLRLALKRTSMTQSPTMTPTCLSMCVRMTVVCFSR
jgi:hypothetical protein